MIHWKYYPFFNFVANPLFSAKEKTHLLPSSLFTHQNSPGDADLPKPTPFMQVFVETIKAPTPCHMVFAQGIHEPITAFFPADHSAKITS